MRMYSERTQVLLSPEQLQRLKRLASRTHKSVGAVIRDAVDAYTTVPPEERRAAVERLIELEAPVDDWEIMKAQIEAERIGSRRSPDDDPGQR
jgi:predicted DNA-binding protein